jgi:hypothetical protein
MLRRAALLAAEEDAARDQAGPQDTALRVTGAKLTDALDELLASRAQLTLALLGGRAAAAPAPG